MKWNRLQMARQVRIAINTIANVSRSLLERYGDFGSTILANKPFIASPISDRHLIWIDRTRSSSEYLDIELF
ncbi:hypothetical protein [Chamaesiphon sp.]|uniref:hypothetical protein n=1 Tax=Chamaesiphon sp. TaxID=2814140 RepID=UPI00359340F5